MATNNTVLGELLEQGKRLLQSLGLISTDLKEHLHARKQLAQLEGKEVAINLAKIAITLILSLFFLLLGYLLTLISLPILLPKFLPITSEHVLISLTSIHLILGLIAFIFLRKFLKFKAFSSCKSQLKKDKQLLANKLNTSTNS